MECGSRQPRRRFPAFRREGGGPAAGHGHEIHPKAPVWLPEKKTLVFSDIPNSKLMAWNAEKGLTVFRESEQANGNLLDLQGRLLSCQHAGRNVIRTEPDGKITVLADRIDGKKLNSPNDLAIHSDGSIWFTDPDYGLKGKPGELDGRRVYRLDPESGEVEMVTDHFDKPNGIVFSKDEKRVYISDTGKLAKVFTFKVPEGGESRALGEPEFEIPVRCDGMCLDANGNLYTTTPKGVQIFDPDGKELATIKVPEQPANVCFGGDNFQTLFITARKSLYAIEMTVAGHKVVKGD